MSGFSPIQSYNTFHHPHEQQKSKDFIRPRELVELPCTDHSLLRAVQAWLQGIPAWEVVRYLGIKEEQLKGYLATPGWRFVEECVRDNVRQVALSSLTRLTHRCFGMIDERLDKGDPIYDQAGEVIGYRAIKAKDLATMVQQFGKQAMEIEERTNRAGVRQSMELIELAKSLQNYALEKHQRREEKVIDVPAGG